MAGRAVRWIAHPSNDEIDKLSKRQPILRRMKMVSLQEAHIYKAFRDHPDRWFTHTEIEPLAPCAHPTTIRMHCLKLATLGLLEKVPLHPALKYKLNPNPPKKAGVHLAKLEGVIDAIS